MLPGLHSAFSPAVQLTPDSVEMLLLPFSICPTLSLPHCVHKSILYSSSPFPTLFHYKCLYFLDFSINGIKTARALLFNLSLGKNISDFSILHHLLTVHSASWISTFDCVAVLVHSSISVHGHLSCLQCGAITDKAARDICVQILACVHFFWENSWK